MNNQNENLELIKKSVAIIGSEKITTAIKWFALESKAKNKEEAYEAFISKVNDYESMIKYGDSSFICKDKNNFEDRVRALFTSNAIQNYIEKNLVK